MNMVSTIFRHGVEHLTGFFGILDAQGTNDELPAKSAKIGFTAARERFVQSD